jgi:hypothetical protein
MSKLISANAKTITITADTDFVAFRSGDHGPLSRGKVINITDMAHIGMVLIAPMPVTAADIISNAGCAMTDKAVWVDRCLVYV